MAVGPIPPVNVPSVDVLIPFRGDDGERTRILAWVQERWEWAYPSFNVRLADSGDEPFSRGNSRNMLVEGSSADVIVLADADTIPIGAGLVESIMGCHQNGDWYVAYPENAYYNLTKAFTEELLSDGCDRVVVPHVGTWDHRLTSWAGLLVMRRKDFIPYDDRFVGWGHEDVAFRLKMDNEFRAHKRPHRGAAAHLFHERGDADFDTAHEKRNRALFDREYRRKYRWKDERL